MCEPSPQNLPKNLSRNSLPLISSPFLALIKPSIKATVHEPLSSLHIHAAYTSHLLSKFPWLPTAALFLAALLAAPFLTSFFTCISSKKPSASCSTAARILLALSHFGTTVSLSLFLTPLIEHASMARIKYTARKSMPPVYQSTISIPSTISTPRFSDSNDDADSTFTSSPFDYVFPSSPSTSLHYTPLHYGIPSDVDEVESQSSSSATSPYNNWESSSTSTPPDPGPALSVINNTTPTPPEPAWRIAIFKIFNFFLYISLALFPLTVSQLRGDSI